MEPDSTNGTNGINRRRFLETVGVGSVMAVAGCTGGSESGGENSSGGGDGAVSTGGKQRPGGQLAVGNESKLTGLDPHKTASVVSWNVIYNVCETLMTFENGKLTGRLVEKYETSDGGKTYTFHLKKGVMFHPPVDRELVADDVVYSFERMQSEKSQMSADVSVIDSMKTDGTHTVSFALEEPFAPLAQFLARISWVVVPKEAVESQGGKIGDFQKPVGTGPFEFEEHVEGDHTTITKFDGYREDGVPLLDSVKFTPVPDADSRVLALQKGDIEFCRGVPGKNAKDLGEDEDIDIVEVKGAAWGEIYINNGEPPWDNPAVRRAVAHLIDRPAIIQAGLYGYGTPAWQPFPKNSFWHTDLENPRKHDVEKAKRILKNAGNPLDGETLSIKTTGQYPIMKSSVTVLVNDLNQAGIDAEIDEMEWGSLLDDFLKGNFAAMGFSVPHKVDPDRYYYNFVGNDGPQYLNYGPDQPDAERMYDLLQEGRQETDQDRRKKTYGELQNLINKNVPWISVGLRSNVLGVRTNVEGDPTWLLPYNRFWKLSKN